MEFKDTQSQIEGIKEIFAEAKTEDNWNLDEPMLYSFYFIGNDADKLDGLGAALEEKDYEFVGVYELGEEETDRSTGEFLLHLDKVEKHTPETLAQRNVEFAKLAEDYGDVSYDGWEFGEEGDYDEEDEEEEDEASENGTA